MGELLAVSTEHVAALAGEVFTRVWRSDCTQPGFALVRFEIAPTSRELRRAMMELVAAFPVPFVPERFGRFDQQVSSKFHRDGAPLASLLVLGYEPSTVRSRFWIADVSAAAIHANVSLNDYLTANNPMFAHGEAALTSFVTEVPLPHGEAFVLAVNNSQLPFDASAKNPLGVLHKAVIPSPDPSGTRVINSIGFAVATAECRGLPPEERERFLSRDDLD